MAGVPQEGPADFNFEVFTGDTYNPYALADEIIWPLINVYSRRDWLKVSTPGQYFSFPASATVEGTTYDVTLHASCYLDNPYREDSDVVDEARLLVEEVVKKGTERSYIIEQAKKDQPVEHNKWGKMANWVVKKAQTYTFDDNFEIYVSPLIEDPNAAELWVPTLDEADEQEMPDVLRRTDVEKIEFALEILQAPPAILQALHAFKENPKQSS